MTKKEHHLEKLSTEIYKMQGKIETNLHRIFSIDAQYGAVVCEIMKEESYR